MSNRFFSIVLAVFAAAVVFACASKKEEVADADEKEWEEMDDFHMVMAETFHPYKDSADLAPVKARAGELASAAENWASAPLPKKVDNDEMKEKLAELKTETSALANLVSETQDEKIIGDQLTKVHDLFHAIQENWYGGGEGHKHEH